jgi:hypothetical protein
MRSNGNVRFRTNVGWQSNEKIVESNLENDTGFCLVGPFLQPTLNMLRVFAGRYISAVTLGASDCSVRQYVRLLYRGASLWNSMTRMQAAVSQNYLRGNGILSPSLVILSSQLFVRMYWMAIAILEVDGYFKTRSGPFLLLTELI